MSLADQELSLDSAKPVFLYAFTLGEKTWRYAAAASDVMTTDGYVWTATQINHDSVKQSGEAVSDTVTITASITIAPAQIFLVSPPGAEVFVRIFQKDYDDPDVFAIYAGGIAQVAPQEPGVVSLMCETASVSLRRQGLRYAWQRGCPYAVYDPLTCKVDKKLYEVPTTIVDIFGVGITVAADLSSELGSIYPGGFLTYNHPVKGIEYLGIEDQNLDTIYIFGSSNDLYVGQSVNLYRGCARTPAACSQFGNYLNYGGVPNMPGSSPFDGNNPFY